MCWGRRLLKSDDVVHRHLALDSSPQCGYDFLCFREESFRYKPDVCESQDWASYQWETRRLPPALLGLGKTNVPDIFSKFVDSMILITGLLIDKFRWQVFTKLSDHGKEKKAMKGPACAIHEHTPVQALTKVEPDSDEALFPMMLDLLDLLHILFNALESSSESMTWWDELEAQLRALCDVMGIRFHTERFKVVCIPPGVRMQYSKMPRLDMKWENLEKILTNILVCFEFFKKYWNYGKMVGGDKKIHRNLYSVVDGTFKDILFYPRCKLLDAFALCIGKWARKFEGCPCPEHVEIQCLKFHEWRARLMEMGVPGGVDACTWVNESNYL